MRIHRLFSFLCILALLSSCNNRQESKARVFLHENNRRYGYTETALVGAGGNQIPFSPYQYATLYGALDTLETLKVFNTVYSRQYPDTTVVSDAFIQAHAARRVKQWKESPHYRKLTWDEFREYWLPYRVETEKFCDYRAALDERYGFISEALKQGMSVLEATNLLQNDLRKRLVFDLRDHASLNQPSLLETMELGKGGCRESPPSLHWPCGTSVSCPPLTNVPCGRTAIPATSGMWCLRKAVSGFRSMGRKTPSERCSLP